MKIYLKEISIGDVTNGYVDNSEDGVYGYGGLLDIRPKYQREFCYDAAKRIEISWYTFMIVYVPIFNLWAMLKYKTWKW